MLSLLNRPESKRNPLPRRRVRPRLEVLESRDCPAAPGVSLSASVLSSGLVQLSGYVTDEAPGTVAVNFGGAMSGSVWADANGFFSYSAEASGLGTVFAQAYDEESLFSDLAYAEIQSNAPSLTLALAQGPNRMVTLTGQVTDESAAGLTISFSGAVTGSVTTGSDGSFSFEVEATTPGLIQATTADGWGLESNVAEVTLTNQAPSLTLSLTRGSGQTVTLSGQVFDEVPAGLTVTFGNAVTGTATTDANGYFSLTTPAASLGTITATVEDWWGLTSEVASANLEDEAPTLTLGFTHGPNQTITLHGWILDEDAEGCVVTFTGAVTGTATADAEGFFTFQTTLTSLGTVQATTQDMWSQNSNTAQVEITNEAPSITLNITYGAGRTVTLSGQVTDEYVAGLTLYFGNAYSGSVTLGTDGSFSVETDAASLGPLELSVTDWWGATGSTSGTIASSAPSLTYTITYGANHTVILSGQVTDEAAGGLTVSFSGVVSGSVQTNADGTFSVALEAFSLGTISATVTDVWSQTSSVVEAAVTNSAPAIQNLAAQRLYGNCWVISGQVTDEYLPGLVITFGGDFGNLQGTEVLSNGTFSTNVMLEGETSGYVTARVTDWWTLESELVQVFVPLS